MKTLFVLATGLALALGSIYPEGETKEQWDARIDANIDRVRKNDVTITIPLGEERWGQRFSLRVNQTRQSFPLGK